MMYLLALIGKQMTTSIPLVLQLIWVVCNLIGLLVLVGGVVLLVLEVGFWGMTYEEVHIVLFSVAVVLIPLLAACAVVLILSLGKGGDGGGGNARSNQYRTIEY